jgi:hypothetical protein
MWRVVDRTTAEACKSVSAITAKGLPAGFDEAADRVGKEVRDQRHRTSRP